MTATTPCPLRPGRGPGLSDESRRPRVVSKGAPPRVGAGAVACAAADRVSAVDVHRADRAAARAQRAEPRSARQHARAHARARCLGRARRAGRAYVRPARCGTQAGAAERTARHRRAAAELRSARVPQPVDAHRAPAARRRAARVEAGAHRTRRALEFAGDLALAEARRRVADAGLSARSRRCAGDAARLGRVRAGQRFGLSAGVRAHDLDQRHGHAAVPRARLSGRVAARQPAREKQQPPDAVRDRAVLDLAARAHDRVVRAAATGRRHQQPADGTRSRHAIRCRSSSTARAC